MDDDFGRRAQIHLAKARHRFDHLAAVDRRRRRHVQRFPCLRTSRLGAGIRVEGSLGRVNPLFDHEGRRHVIALRDSRDLDANRPLEIVDPVERDDKALTAPGGNRQLVRAGTKRRSRVSARGSSTNT